MFTHIKETIMAFKPEIKPGDTVKLKGCYYSPEMVVDYVEAEGDEVFVTLVWFTIHNVLQTEILPLHLLVKVKALKHV